MRKYILSQGLAMRNENGKIQNHIQKSHISMFYYKYHKYYLKKIFNFVLNSKKIK